MSSCSDLVQNCFRGMLKAEGFLKDKMRMQDRAIPNRVVMHVEEAIKMVQREIDMRVKEKEKQLHTDEKESGTILCRRDFSKTLEVAVRQSVPKSLQIEGFCKSLPEVKRLFVRFAQIYFMKCHSIKSISQLAHTHIIERYSNSPRTSMGPCKLDTVYGRSIQ